MEALLANLSARISALEHDFSLVVGDEAEIPAHTRASLAYATLEQQSELFPKLQDADAKLQLLESFFVRLAPNETPADVDAASSEALPPALFDVDPEFHLQRMVALQRHSHLFSDIDDLRVFTEKNSGAFAAKAHSANVQDALTCSATVTLRSGQMVPMEEALEKHLKNAVRVLGLSRRMKALDDWYTRFVQQVNMKLCEIDLMLHEAENRALLNKSLLN